MKKYLTFFASRENINIYEILNTIFISPDLVVVKINSHIGLLSLAIIDKSFDINKIPETSINFFNIKIHDINTLREYLREVSDYSLVENSLPNNEITIHGPWKFNELTDYIYIDKKPYDNWIWNEDTGNWNPPISKPNMDNIFDFNWNQLKGNWDIFLKQNSARKYRGFSLWKLVPKTNGDFYEKTCNTTEYMLKSFENITHNTLQQADILSSDHDNEFLKQKSINSEHISASLYRVIKQHHTVLDFSPHSIITYSIMEKEYIDSYEKDPLVVMHPQCITHTLHELFRLIIEWAWCYRNCENTEPIAIHCDTLLRELQMPLNVREELINLVPDQAVSKFIKNNIHALEVLETDPECPSSFNEWISDIYLKYKRRNIGDPLNMSLENLPDYYPV